MKGLRRLHGNSICIALSSTLLFGLGACGGDGTQKTATTAPAPAPATYTVGGVVTGLRGSGLELQLNSGELLPVTADGAFVFAAALQTSVGYSVAIARQPGGQLCAPGEARGTVSGGNVTNIEVRCVAMLETLFRDDFERPDQQGPGVTSGGQAWLFTGPGYLNVAIQGGRYVSGAPELNNNLSYIGMLMREQPLKLGGNFSFVPSTTAGRAAPVVALISSSDTAFTLRRMVHLIAGRGGVALTWWLEADQDNAPAHCTGVGEYTAPLANDGTSYPLYMTIRGDTVIVDKPDGTQLTCTDPHFVQAAGALGIWELAYGNTAVDVPRWDMAEAFAEVPLH